MVQISQWFNKSPNPNVSKSSVDLFRVASPVKLGINVG